MLNLFVPLRLLALCWVPVALEVLDFTPSWFGIVVVPMFWGDIPENDDLVSLEPEAHIAFIWFTKSFDWANSNPNKTRAASEVVLFCQREEGFIYLGNNF